MTTGTKAIAFTHVVEKPGAAHGMSITGKRRPAEEAPVAQDVPLIIAVHGGTYTSDYFDIPGYSLLDRAAGLGIPIVAIVEHLVGGRASGRHPDCAFASVGSQIQNTRLLQIGFVISDKPS